MKFILMCLFALTFGVNTVLHADELSFSQYKGKNYKAVKKEFLAKGWENVPKREGEESVSELYPEVTCGKGRMPICSVGFRNQQDSVAFIVETSGAELIVSGVY